MFAEVRQYTQDRNDNVEAAEQSTSTKRKADEPVVPGPVFGFGLDKRSRGLDQEDDEYGPFVGHRVGVIKSPKELFATTKQGLSAYDFDRSVVVDFAGKISDEDLRKAAAARKKGFGSWGAYQKAMQVKKDDAELEKLNKAYIKGYLTTDDPSDDDLRWQALNALKREQLRKDSGTDEENRLARKAGFESYKALLEAEAVAALKRRGLALKERTWQDFGKEALAAGLAHAGPLGASAASVLYDRANPTREFQSFEYRPYEHPEDTAERFTRFEQRRYADEGARSARVRRFVDDLGYTAGAAVAGVGRKYNKRNYQRFQGHY